MKIVQYLAKMDKSFLCLVFYDSRCISLHISVAVKSDKTVVCRFSILFTANQVFSYSPRVVSYNFCALDIHYFCLEGGPKSGFNFGINSVNVAYTDFNHFYCYNKKCMTHKSKITPATSPLFCNPPT